MRPLRILIADDSEFFATVLEENVEAEPDMDVIGVARDGAEAVTMCAELEPDIVLMDIRMPKLDGLSATESIMADTPTPILIVTTDPVKGGVDLSFQALSSGALDLVSKPSSLPWEDADRQSFLRKVRLLAQIPVVRHQRATRRRKHVSLHGQPVSEDAVDATVVVGIVASTGGPRALAKILGSLPPEFPAPIFVVQHIMPGFSSHLARWLSSTTDLRVRESTIGVVAQPGEVYLAPAGHHLTIEKDLTMRHSDREPVNGHRPSGDLLLESIGRAAPGRSVGLVLSGMGNDGTTGLATIHRSGGVTLVQDRESAVVYGMPQSAIDHGVVSDVVELPKIARRLVREVEALREDR